MSRIRHFLAVALAAATLVGAGVAGTAAGASAAAATAGGGGDILTAPTNGQVNMDTTRPFTWTTVAASQGTILVVGTTKFGTDLVNSGVLPPGQAAYSVPALPTGRTLYATLLTKIGGAWSQYDAITFTAAPSGDTLTAPTDGQVNVDTTRPFTWTTVPASQGTILVVGTTKFGTDLVNSGVLPPGQAAYSVPALPTGRTLYATLLTKTAGAWSQYNAVTFAAAPGRDTLTYPTDGQADVVTNNPFTWSTIPASQGSILVVGTTRYGTDVANSGVLPAGQSSYSVAHLPTGTTLYATLLTKTNGAFTRFQAITFVSRGTLPHGAPDLTFGADGQVTLAPTNSSPRSLAFLASTGRTLAAYVEGGNSYVTRLSATGVPDLTFGSQGTAALPAGMDVRQIADGGAGRVLAVGFPGFDHSPTDPGVTGTMVVRLTAGGALDTSFATGGVATLAAPPAYSGSQQVMVGPDGRIFVAMQVATGTSTSELGVAAFTPDGVPDTSFGTSGQATTTIGGQAGGAPGLAIEDNGDLVATIADLPPGGTATQALVARFLPTGQPDTTFADHGVYLASPAPGSDDPERVVVAPTGDIVVAGSVRNGTVQSGLLFKLSASGALDTSFGTGGAVIEHPAGDIDNFVALSVGADDTIYGLMIQQDGPFNGSLRRYTFSGLPDTTFGTAGVVPLTGDIPSDLVLAVDGRPEVAFGAPPSSSSIVAERFFA